jgi:hypothetical protein
LSLVASRPCSLTDLADPFHLLGGEPYYPGRTELHGRLR